MLYATTVLCEVNVCCSSSSSVMNAMIVSRVGDPTDVREHVNQRFPAEKAYVSLTPEREDYTQLPIPTERQAAHSG